MLLERAAEAMPDRMAVGSGHGGLTYAGLFDLSRRIAAVVTGTGAERVVVVAENSPLMPALLYGTGLAGVPFVPVNYRLADAPLRAVLGRAAPALAVVDSEAIARVAGVGGLDVVSTAEFLARVEDAEAVAEAGVIGIPDDEWGETVAAVVVLEPGADADVAELQDWIRSRLRSSRTPTVIEFREALPYNATGKLLRRVLRTELIAPASGAAGRG